MNNRNIKITFNEWFNYLWGTGPEPTTSKHKIKIFNSIKKLIGSEFEELWNDNEKLMEENKKLKELFCEDNKKRYDEEFCSLNKGSDRWNGYWISRKKYTEHFSKAILESE